MTVPGTKFSQINPAPSSFTTGDQLVGVRGGTTDLLFTAGSSINILMILTANTSYFIRTTGSDTTGDGTAAKPWATIQHAMDTVAATVEGGGFIVIFDIGAGSFAGLGAKNIVGVSFLFLNGAGRTLTTIVSGDNDGVYNTGDCLDFETPVDYSVCFDNMTLAPSIAGTGGIVCQCPGQFIAGNPAFTHSDWGFVGAGASSAGVQVLQPGAIFYDAGGTGVISGTFDVMFHTFHTGS